MKMQLGKILKRARRTYGSKLSRIEIDGINIDFHKEKYKGDELNKFINFKIVTAAALWTCLLYTSDAADE